VGLQLRCVRVFRHFSWLEVVTDKTALPRPAHQQVTRAVSPFAKKLSMKTKHYLPFLLVLLLLVACSSQVSPESSATQQASPKPEITALATTPKVVDPTPIDTLVPTATVAILPTQTPTLVDLESLPKLSEVIISAADSENIDEFRYNPLLLITDATNEMQDSCLWDCVKYRYSLEEGTLTIMLLRAGNHQKAESILANLRKDFLKTVGIEYTANDIPMPPTSWTMVDAASSKDSRTGVAGIAHGSIVVLVTYSQVFCEYTTEFGKYCEGNIMPLAGTSVYFLEVQIRKLETVGYPK
jgi:hypothetical protein